MQLRDTEANATARRSRRTLWLLFALCAAPIVGSYAVYHFWRPTARVNYGELLEPRPLPGADLVSSDGKPFRLAQLKGEWVLLTSGPAMCDDACRDRLVYTRQVRLAQGAQSGRVERVWLLTDAGSPDAALLAEHPDLRVVRDRDGGVVSGLPAPGPPSEHIYVIDPLGNLMMRFPANPDPKRILKDLSRLLRHSKWK
jgi:cytochrome oxidase Cu insertion factor (SCO1/SenC/PrrC family)